MIADQLQRQQALDPCQSFIVQAPAGSGKTELLIQRYLVLLAIVNEPEEIVAITFTRKAASEMQDRVLDALRLARDQQEPETDHQKQTYMLAKAVLRRDQERAWSITEQTGRLKIKTIDSFCADLSRQMPVLSRFGSPPGLIEDAEELYREAARATIGELETDNQWSDAMEALATYLDNNLADIENLIVSMLRRRDQWVRHVVSDEDTQRQALESDINYLVQQHLSRLKNNFPKDLQVNLAEVLGYCCQNIRDQQDHELFCCSELSSFSDIGTLEQWKAISRWLMVQKGGWRSRLTVREGFADPKATKEEKEKSKEAKMNFGKLVEGLDQVSGLKAQIFQLQSLPETKYTDNHWLVLKALFDVLRVAVGQLELVFQARNQVDFTAMSQSALQALGAEDNPTDLALALDYRIQHILIDEFQDTSFSQFELLQRLTLGWQGDDGRTLFCVGDPMQSIYRFREAEVGLYLRAKEMGIGQIRLQPITLEVNFRSQAKIVEWINAAFPKILAHKDRMEEGAVSYTDSVPFHSASIKQPAVSIYPLYEKDREGEAEQVVKTVKQLKAAQPDTSIAILVRSRNHLMEIVPGLKRSGLPFQAIDIERLGHRPVVQDLMSITRSLIHYADRTAWLAVLRAPWCGLSLIDLHVLLGDEKQNTVWSAINRQDRMELLRREQQVRLKRVLDAYRHVQQHHNRRLRQRVEAIWMRLGGPACVADETDLQDALVYLDLLDELEQGGQSIEIQRLAAKVEKLSALPDVNADGNLKILTIHKSKGLEFDHVIIPGLGNQSRSGDRRLLKWMEFAKEDKNAGLLLAPIKEKGDKNGTLYEYINEMEKKKEQHEMGRLFYVAATRAKKSLHWFGHVELKVDDDGGITIKEPVANSPLSTMWPALKNEFEASLPVEIAKGPKKNNEQSQRHTLQPGVIRRHKNEWCLPGPSASVAYSADPLSAVEPDIQLEQIEFNWAGETARQIGLATHQFLEKIVRGGLDFSDEKTREQQRACVSASLRQEGVRSEDHEKALKQTLRNLCSICEDERGRWILDPGHRDSRCEYAVSGYHDNRLVSIVIDRTFIDQDGVRWIIDYKTGIHSGGGLEEFLDREKQRYQNQLKLYANLMQQLDPRPTRVALYYPQMKGWREWELVS